jgi:site-specific DNA recombinase
VPLYPGIANVYAGRIAHLASALNDPSEKAEAADIMRGLIDKIILRPDADALNGHVIELYGELGAVLSLCGGT